MYASRWTYSCNELPKEKISDSFRSCLYYFLSLVVYYQMHTGEWNEDSNSPLFLPEAQQPTVLQPTASSLEILWLE